MPACVLAMLRHGCWQRCGVEARNADIDLYAASIFVGPMLTCRLAQESRREPVVCASLLESLCVPPQPPLLALLELLESWPPHRTLDT
eukprot:707708-Rhodomonas_salina.5